MFHLSILKDTVAIHPQHFAVPAEEALVSSLNKKYANRVLHDVGLCICVFDISEAGEGTVRYGDGFLWYKVIFRMVVFRPFISELVIGKVKSSDETGIRVSLGFFDDIWIPADDLHLPKLRAFDTNTRAWFTVFPSEEEEEPTHEQMMQTPLDQRLSIDKDEVIRIRIESEEFFDDEPGPPKAAEGVMVDRVPARSPYTLEASIVEGGLGPVAWWQTEGDEQVQDEDEEL